ncbi:MAG: Rieske 2Fe-2S domain-containing protein [Paraburkholderia tropica]|uniref:Rieske-like 2Fe-2S protein n=1 Tax=Paraburkholderia tropica TaxID=92647 RepID=A0ABX5MJ12_9BURK|nr:Rieske 2Fe-2S domain-containing protein [Paraburkholderia tropica]PXX12565.1 Rieske-like 2Fe-2S protein [Paraburkholderia tropica]PZW76542.1 Rieske-like 2Fe-2S protein [Paraburkholderia tropica]
MSDSSNSLDLLARVGPGTPMGNLFRRFWLPAALSSELSTPDCPPVRLRILGEDLVAFRDTNGRVGVVSAYCPHRLAPLFFGRNEDCGIRCAYHGWKFNVKGECVDIPNIVPPDNFSALKERARITAYPTREAGGMIWAYMGPQDVMPDLPAMEWLRLPKEQVHVGRWHHKTNWLSAMEGEIDSSHISFLHSVLDANNEAPDRVLMTQQDGAPEITIRETDYGFLYGARRRFDGKYYWRVTQWMLPMWGAIGSIVTDFNGNGRGWVPIDDYATSAFCYRYRPDRALRQSEIEELDAGGLFPPLTTRGIVKLPHGYTIDTFLPVANDANDYLMDREYQRTTGFSGIWGLNPQDRSLQEGMPSVPGEPLGLTDRRGEHLVRSDLPIITARRILVRMARELADGKEPAGAVKGEQYGLRAIAMVTTIADFDEFLATHGDLLRAPSATAPGVKPGKESGSVAKVEEEQS